MNKVFLIFNDTKLELQEISVVIVGDEEDAEKYCEDYNAKCTVREDEVWYEEMVILNEHL